MISIQLITNGLFLWPRFILFHKKKSLWISLKIACGGRGAKSDQGLTNFTVTSVLTNVIQSKLVLEIFSL